MSDLWLICYTNSCPKDRTLKWGFKVCEYCVIYWVKAEAKYEFIKAGKLNRSVEDAISKQQRANYSTIVETLKCVNIEWQKGEDGEGANAPQDIKHRLTFEEVVEYVQHSDLPDCKENLDKVLFDSFREVQRQQTGRQWWEDAELYEGGSILLILSKASNVFKFALWTQSEGNSFPYSSI